MQEEEEEISFWKSGVSDDGGEANSVPSITQQHPVGFHRALSIRRVQLNDSFNSSSVTAEDEASVSSSLPSSINNRDYCQ